MTVAAISELLGGLKMLKRTVEHEFELTAITREGLPVQALTQIAGDMGIDTRRLAGVVGISERTLSRRMASAGRMTAEESDRVVRLARVVAKALDTFGTMVKASHWLQAPNRALAGEVPLQMLDTDTGARSVEEILYRIDYGIYS